jgi:SAM-dependent methyltransferase
VELISLYDRWNYRHVRNNAESSWKLAADEISKSRKVGNEAVSVLEVAPQKHGGLESILRKWPEGDLQRVSFATLDIDPLGGASLIGDLCDLTDLVPDESFDLVLVTEVLEHVTNPFSAAMEILRILKVGGVAIVTTPFDFRIHGPLPDNWRFTEYGLRELFKQFSDVNILAVKSVRGSLMPVAYRLVARK